MQMIVGPGWAPSSMVIKGQAMSGVEGIVSGLEPTDITVY
jgi:hypothetical protein